MPISTNNLYANLLVSLKRKLNEQAMSALVGAGFSKNFNNDIFPSWWELIFDMVREELEPDLVDRFKQLHPKTKASGKAYEKFLKERIEKYIDNLGPLEAVSEFIRRKGYREAVDVRIETKTPFIDIIDGIRYINYKQKGKVLRRAATGDELLVHQKLVSLPWNNIYTTNYDNLLEKSVDLTIGEQFQRAIDDLSEEIEADEQKVITKLAELDTLKNELEELENKVSNVIPAGAVLPSDTGTGIDETRIKKLIPGIATLERQIAYVKDGIKNKDERILGLKRNKNEVNSLVTYSSQLALKKNGNIIKLHGSVRTNPADPYGFDNDARTHYVISKEDFESYPNKHEAFTQLMRIALLQESFCLLGFSGIDPNFLAWIGWVRDVVKRKTETETVDEDDKIYLIDVLDKPVEAEKALFHLNHRIAFIPLAHPDCRFFLETQTGRKLPDNPQPKQFVELFLDYLSLETMPSKIKIAFEVFQQDRYQQLWQKNLLRLTLQGDLDNSYLFNKADEFSKLRKYNRIPANAHNIIDRYNVLNLLEGKLNNAKNDTEELARLISFATDILEEQHLQVKNIFGESTTFYDLIHLAKTTNHEKYPMLLLINLRDAIWANDDDRFENASKQLKTYDLEYIKQEFEYLRILHAFFNLRFSDAIVLLSAWVPQAHWVIKKAGMLLLTDRDAALPLVRSERPETVQETVYQLQFLGFASIGSGAFLARTRYNELAGELTYEGLKDADYNLNQILNKLNRIDKKIVPYGYNKFTTSRTISFGGENDWALSQMFFRILAETGFPLSMPGVSLKDWKDVHAALFLAHPSVPYPVIYYLFQYRDEKLIIRLAQDFATNTDLANELIRIFTNISHLFFDRRSPAQYKENGLTFLSELINVLEPSVWEPFFIRVWKKLIKEKLLFVERHHFKNIFIENGLRLIQSTKTAVMVINDSLSALIGNEIGVEQQAIVRYFYSLNFNETIKERGGIVGKGLNESNLAALTEAISGDIDLLFIFGNLNFSLSQAQQNAITCQLTNLSTFQSQNERVWRIVLYFAQGRKEIIANVKNSIIDSPRLWDAGFTEQGLSGTNNYIPISQLQRVNNISTIDWSVNDLEILYGRLKETLSKIERWLNKETDNFSDFKGILEEMAFFLSAEKNRLTDKTEYDEVVQRVGKLYAKEKRYASIREGLLSSEKEEFTTALSETFYQLYYFHNINELDFELKNVLNKVLLQSEPGLAEALSTVIDWFSSQKSNIKSKKYEEILLEILKQYQRQAPKDIDFPFLESNLIRLADLLKYWKNNDPVINEQLTLLNSSRFMDIRYNLKGKLHNKT